MKSKGIIGLLISALLILGLVMACAPAAAPPTEAPPTAPPTEAPPTEAPPTAPGPVKMFTLEDTPYIENRTPVFINLISVGVGPMETLIKNWAAHTGIPMRYDVVPFEVTYPKLNLELIAGTAAYDMVANDGPFTGEWAPYMWDLYEMADEFDPGGRAALAVDFEQQYPSAIRNVCDRHGKITGIPFFNYQHALWLRQDAYDHPTEQANFLAEYGYELNPPTSYEELYDQEEFFTRKKGELFKGKPLEWDLYGCAISGRVEVNDETCTEIWTRGGDWWDMVRDDEGNVIKFVVTEENRRLLTEALTSLKKQTEWASPACATSYWDTTVPEFINGRHIIFPHLYLPMVPWATDIFGVIPDAKIGLYAGGPVMGPGMYGGNYFQSVPLTTKNPEAMYWLVKYLASEEAQRHLVEAGNPGTRMDVVRDTRYHTGITMVEDYDGVVCNDKSGLVGALNVCSDIAQTKYETWEVFDNWTWFNDIAGGKQHQMTVLLCHEAVAGIRPVDEVVDEILKRTVEIHAKYGDLPIRSEIEF